MNNKHWFFNLTALLLPLSVTPAHAALKGALETANCDFIRGWAWNDANPTTRIKLDIYDIVAAKATRLTTVTAQQFRNDLLSSGMGDGKYGFTFVLPVGIRTAHTHQFSVRFQGTHTELTNSPKTTATACYGKLNDTGNKSCSNASVNGLKCPVSGYQGQDGDYGRDAKARAGKLVKKGYGPAGFDLTFIANDGSTLPESAKLGPGKKDAACLRDHVTGLLWALPTNDGGLRDQDNTFSWYDPNNKTNGGLAGAQNLGRCTGHISCDTHGYTKAINALKLCGKTGWRLPKPSELIAYTFGKTFSNPQGNPLWSSAPDAADLFNAWAVVPLIGGSISVPDVKLRGYFVWLVNGGQ